MIKNKYNKSCKLQHHINAASSSSADVKIEVASLSKTIDIRVTSPSNGYSNINGKIPQSEVARLL